MRIKKPFKVVAVGDLIQMIPFSKREDDDIKALIELMQNSDMTLANNENTIVDRLTFRGPIAHMEAPASVADDWANMGIRIVSKANNHTFDCGDAGLIQNFQQLQRVGIEYVGTDYNVTEARLARFCASPKGTVGCIGAYSEVEDYSQMYGLPGGDPITVNAEQLDQLRSIRDTILSRRVEVQNPILEPAADRKGSILLFGRIFRLPEAEEGANTDIESLKKRLEHHLSARGTITMKNNSLRLKVHHTVTETQMNQLRSIAGSDGISSSANDLEAFGVHLTVASAPGEYRYTMNEQDRRDILREVQSGKQASDFLAVTIHWHQNRFAFQAYSFDHYPADYQIKFAHDVIDHGADFFFAHGVHTLKGVEIYKGKPIFYGLSNFVFQHQTFRSWRDDAAGRAPVPLDGEIVGDGRDNEARWEWLNQPVNCEALLVSGHFDQGKLVKVYMYPADLGRTARSGSDIGIPRRPSPEVAQDILERVTVYSRPFGTNIEITDGVGIIHMT